MKKALVLGGTGLTGKKLLWLLLDDKRYSKVILLVRKPMDIIHEKLEQVIYNFDSPEPSVFNDVADVFCCLGTTIQQAGSKAAFYKVDYEYVTVMAAMAYASGVQKFALMSSLGANSNSRFFYNRTKGQVETAVNTIGFAGCYIFRPSVLLGKRSRRRLAETVLCAVMICLDGVIPNHFKAIKSQTVALAMIAAVNSPHLAGTIIFESEKIKVLAASVA